MRSLTCSLCGHTFAPQAEAACGACPLRRGCPLVCCPACRHVTVDVDRSRLAHLLAPLVHRGVRAGDSRPAKTLADVQADGAAVISGFRPGAPPDRCEQLRAYGLTTGRTVHVVQQSPVTVVRIDHTELGLERDVARQIEVED